MIWLDFGTAFVTNDVVPSLDDKEEYSQNGGEKNYGRGPVKQKRVLGKLKKNRKISLLLLN